MSNIIRIDNSNISSILHGNIDIGKPFSNNIYLIDAHIAGTSHVENIKDIEPSLTIDKKLKFLREPNNEYDDRAIKIVDENDNKIGYVPRNKNEILSRLMDGGKVLYGTIYDKEFFGEWIKITIQIYLED